ncbi:autophagy protein 16 [Aspergillus campestris IBT 28561]|uniref:Autophagy protein 16 n=1 Tax=Aspergillus campestris (strain IBT 28561) TaxID=1392248 RepID=A0A2I1D162_ASPC2|nr:autophagy protein 16 [Aspergillus campestris IBT 28561]PKY03598.1 autophagy protein 16 [Aspergillus campestris IBT 28561]
MAPWGEEYSVALAVRDRREKANSAIYDAYTKLADRASRSTPTTAPPSGAQSPAAAARSPSTTDPKKQSKGESAQSPHDLLALTRADLSEAQRSRSELQDRLNRTTADLEKLRKRNTLDGRRIKTLEQDATHLQLRLKDRDEELRGKAKLLDDFQDELASLNLQLNMAEERTGRLQRENQELVDRWMVRMGREAEAMNDASKYS